mgnify:CR=1 FL=1
MKLYVAERNSTFKIADVERLTHEAVASISVDAWEKCVRHAEKLQEENYEWEIPRDDVLEPFIINLCDSDSESEDDDNDDGKVVSDSD